MISGTRQTQQQRPTNEHSLIKANYVTSPPLVLSYALAGSVLVDLEEERIGFEKSIRDIWPNRQEIELIEQLIVKKILAQVDERIHVRTIHWLSSFECFLFQTGNPQWNSLKVPSVDLHLQYPWAEYSTYVKKPPFFDKMVIEMKRRKKICRMLIHVL